MKTKAKEPSYDHVTQAHSGDVLWAVWDMDAPATVVHVRARTWFLARRAGAQQLGTIPLSCTGRCIEDSVKKKTNGAAG